MAKSFDYRIDEPTNARLKKHIRDRVEGCFKPRCWIIKDPNDTGKIYLDKGITKGKGQYVRLRRYLFFMTYGFAPEMRKITMRCGENDCVNPTHMQVKGFEPPYPIMQELIIEKKWITLDQARDYYSTDSATEKA